jgi:hypothetical protein
MIKNIFSVVLMASSAYAFEGQFATEAEAIDNGVVRAVAGNQDIGSGLNQETPVQLPVSTLGEETSVNVEQQPEVQVAAEEKQQPEVQVAAEEKQQPEVQVAAEEKQQPEVRVETGVANKELNEKVQPEHIQNETGAAPTKTLFQSMKSIAYTLSVGHFVQYPKLSLLTCTTYNVGGYWYGGLNFLTNKWYAMGLFTAASLTTHALGGLYNWYNPQVKNANSTAKA